MKIDDFSVVHTCSNRCVRSFHRAPSPPACAASRPCTGFWPLRGGPGRRAPHTQHTTLTHMSFIRTPPPPPHTQAQLTLAREGVTCCSHSSMRFSEKSTAARYSAGSFIPGAAGRNFVAVAIKVYLNFRYNCTKNGISPPNIGRNNRKDVVSHMDAGSLYETKKGPKSDCRRTTSAKRVSVGSRDGETCATNNADAFKVNLPRVCSHAVLQARRPCLSSQPICVRRVGSKTGPGMCS
jgi:hypothetical protein